MFAQFVVQEYEYVHEGSCKQLIGEGRFGTVYKVIGRDNRTYALREIKSQEGSATDDKQLMREIEFFVIVKSHPAISKLIGYFVSDHKTLVLEYMPNGTLEQLIKRVERGHKPEEWSPTNRSKMIIGLASAMMHLHSYKAVHRYLTPRNVMFDLDWRPKLVDFGFARLVDDSNASQMSNIDTGNNYMYAAPEAIQREEYNNKVDVYAFGMILYTIVTGKQPRFPDVRTPYNGQQKIISGVRPEIDPSCNPLLADIIQQCWSQQPTDRPEFADIVKCLIEEEEPLFPDTNMNEYIAYRDDVVRATNISDDVWKIFNRSTLDTGEIAEFEKVKSRADAGDSKACLKAGKMLEKGRGTVANLEEAFEYFMRAAEQGEHMAMYNVGVCYLNGYGVAANSKNAAFWLKQAADADFPNAIISYALLLEKGVGCKADPIQAYMMLSEVADKHDLGEAQYHIARMCHTGIPGDDGIPQDFDRAREYYRKACDNGQEGAMCELARMLIEGHGCAPNINEGIRMYEQAAVRGFSMANYNLGVIYQTGRAGFKDEARARAYYKAACDQNSTLAMVRYGAILLQDAKKCVPGDPLIEKCYTDAARLFKAAADRGEAVAQNNYGKLLIQGIGVEKDQRTGCQYLARAVKGGVVPAMMLLGDIFSGQELVDITGNKFVASDIKTSIKSARQFYQMAADCGCAQAMERLALLG